MTITSIAKKHNKSVMFVSLLARDQRKTYDALLALDIARLSGLVPIEHISPDCRDTFIRAYPELLQPPAPAEKEEEGV